MKSKLFKKLSVTLLASTLAVNALPFVSSVGAAETKFEFEDATLIGTCTIESDATASGGSFVFLEGGDIELDIEVETTGMYELSISYSAPYGDKIQNLYVNGVNQGQLSFPTCDAFREVSGGVVKLEAGKNTVTIKNSWGWTNFDYLKVSSADLPSLVGNKNLCDPKATAKTQSLMSYLSDVYGKNIISGQQEYYGTSRDDEFNYIKGLCGDLPAIRGFDFGETCPLYAWDAGTAERAIDWVNNGGIATASWHINVPVTMANYTLGSTMDFSQTTYSEKTDFVTANVMVEGTVEHDYFLLAVDNLAASLKKMADADTPLIFRPFHEAEGNGGIDGKGAWFWWAKEGAEVYKELYIYLYELLTEEYGLHNLIWEFNSYTYEQSYAWYPGAEYVDIVGYDKYNAKDWSTGIVTPNLSSLSSTFYKLVEMYAGDGKMVAMAENDTIPSIENLTVEKAGWLYFCPWYGEHLMDANYNTKESLADIYKSDYVITLSELPANLYSYDGGTEPIIVPTEPKPTEETTEPIPTFTVQKYAIADVTPGDVIVVNLEGDAGAYANGCFGYAIGKDWFSEEWEVSALLADGTYNVEYTVPEDVTSIEFQIWWCSVGEEIADIEMSSWNVKGESSTKLGDANCDGLITVADVVAAAATAADPATFKLSEQGAINADVHMTGDGVSATDASMIQEMALGIA